MIDFKKEVTELIKKDPVEIFKEKLEEVKKYKLQNLDELQRTIITRLDDSD